MIAQPKLILGAGGAEVLIQFVALPGEPIKECAQLEWNGRPLVEALFADILQPFLTQWARVPGDRRGAIKASVDDGMDRCIAAFRACAPEQAAHEQRSVMAALAVVANLQRTLLLLGETLARPKQNRARRVAIKLCRPWCGLVPRRRRSLTAGISQFKPLVRALACSPGEIDARCREALATLRDDYRSGRFIAREDLEPSPRR